MHNDTKKAYIVADTSEETDSVRTIRLSGQGEMPAFMPGQFITVYFPESKTPEGKAYSISATPEEGMAITVKAVGEFSNKLCSMHSGDIVYASDPYGYFIPEQETSALVLIAAGIGITPFRSIIKQYLKQNPDREITLFYSNKTVDSIVFREEFAALEKAHSHFKCVHFITQEHTMKEGFIQGRMTPQHILGYAGDVKEKEILICGSIAFVRDMWRGLRALGVPEDIIYTEAFFS